MFELAYHIVKVDFHLSVLQRARGQEHERKRAQERDTGKINFHSRERERDRREKINCHSKARAGK